MTQPAVPSTASANRLTRALCGLVLLLMTGAVLYAACMAIRNYGRIGV
jgi:hypothetical protein